MMRQLSIGLTFVMLAACHHEGADKEVDKSGEILELTAKQVAEARITVGKVDEQDVGGAIVTTGKVTFDDLRVSHVYSPVTGRVTHIQAQPGQRVKKGDELVTILSPDVGSAFSDLGKAHADATAAEHDFKRKKDLFDAHAGSQYELEQSEDLYRKAKAELERAQQKARLFRQGTVDSVSQEYTLRALIDGEVVARNVNPGAEVLGQYSGGAAVELFTIGELDKVWVMADVFETDLAQIKIGASVHVRAVAVGDTFEGHVEWVSGSLDPQSRTARVRCSVSNPKKQLKAEMYASVSISVAEQRALAIPRTAVRRMGDQTVVYVEVGASDNGSRRFERRPVAVVEDEGGFYVPVTHGLDKGETIITSRAEEPSDVQQSINEIVTLSKQQLTTAKLTIVPVEDHDVGASIAASGKVTFDDLRVSHVFSPVTGRVTQIHAQPGQRVKKGAALVTILSPDVGTAFSDLGKAQADQVAAEHDYKRKKALFEARAGSQSDLEAATDNYEKAKAELARAEQKARLFRQGTVDSITQEYTLRALIDGEVIARNVNPGAEVLGQYSGGAAVELFTIGELDQVWVLADVYEMDVARVKPHANVQVKVVAYPKPFEGHVDFVSDTIDATSRTAKVRCAIKNPDRELKPEMYATVSISVDARKALAIPREALLRLGGKTIVFVQLAPEGDKLRYQRRVVSVVENSASEYLPVLSGVERGESVVATGSILLAGEL